MSDYPQVDCDVLAKTKDGNPVTGSPEYQAALQFSLEAFPGYDASARTHPSLHARRKVTVRNELVLASAFEGAWVKAFRKALVAGVADEDTPSLKRAVSCAFVQAQQSRF
jgi:hypothetical protein